MTVCELCNPDPAGEIVASSAEWRVVLVDDALYPGFCRVIWNAHVNEMTDLCAAERTMFMDVVWQVEAAVREVLQPHKINLASLGNMVPHLHWHIIPRFTDDTHFPNPIWGTALRDPGDSLPARRALTDQLKAVIAHKLGRNTLEQQS